MSHDARKKALHGTPREDKIKFPDSLDTCDIIIWPNTGIWVAVQIIQG